MIDSEPIRPRFHSEIQGAEELGAVRMLTLHTLGGLSGDGELTKRFLD
jgi:hypothetical protein